MPGSERSSAVQRSALQARPTLLLRLDVTLCGRQGFRRDALIERKIALSQMIHRLPADSRLRFADHVERSGVELFERVCMLDLEGQSSRSTSSGLTQRMAMA